MDKISFIIASSCSFSGHHACFRLEQLAGGKVQVESVLARKNGNRINVDPYESERFEDEIREQQIVFTPVMVGTDSIRSQSYHH